MTEQLGFDRTTPGPADRSEVTAAELLGRARRAALCEPEGFCFHGCATYPPCRLPCRWAQLDTVQRDLTEMLGGRLARVLFPDLMRQAVSPASNPVSFGTKSMAPWKI
jgi:hypothetical protein